MFKRPIYYMTQQGLDDLKKEEQKLIGRRPQVVTNMSSAREQGDLSENAGYHAAKEELAKIDSRLKELHYIIRFAKISQSSDAEEVKMGSTVELANDQSQSKFTIVSTMETNPAKNKISDSSPIGQALIGKKTGQTIKVKMPKGVVSYKILKVN